MKKTVRVTIEKEFEIDIPDDMLTPEYQAEFEQSFWQYEDDNELFLYAARMVAQFSGGYFEGLGQVGQVWSTYPCVPNVKYTELYDEIETEVL